MSSVSLTRNLCGAANIRSEIPDRDGGWDFAVARRKLVLLPFISYQRGSFNFYFGWREHGNFGIKLNVSAPPANATHEIGEPKPEVD